MKKIIVTGVSEGLGFEVAKKCIKLGIEVVGISRIKPKLDVTHYSVDLTNKNQIIEVVKKIEDNHSSFDALINCAGILSISKLENISYEKLEEVFKVNVLAPAFLTSKLITLIKQNQADIVNVSSTVGLKAYEEQLAYGASKWGIRGVTQNLQLELKKTKCRVIGFNPGGFKSRIFEKATNQKIELGDEWMEPRDLAELMITILQLPKNMEVSEITINRK
ncbi:MAG: SDR family oxidoreductase [Nanoarchaeota archaeon]|nr:SDR family oxidoreductase [Nanoarchaeota archaeon]